MSALQWIINTICVRVVWGGGDWLILLNRFDSDSSPSCLCFCPLVVLDCGGLAPPTWSFSMISHWLGNVAALANVGCATIGWLPICTKLVWMCWWVINAAMHDMMALSWSELTLDDMILTHSTFVGRNGPFPCGKIAHSIGWNYGGHRPLGGKAYMGMTCVDVGGDWPSARMFSSSTPISLVFIYNVQIFIPSLGPIPNTNPLVAMWIHTTVGILVIILTRS